MREKIERSSIERDGESKNPESGRERADSERKWGKPRDRVGEIQEETERERE